MLAGIILEIHINSVHGINTASVGADTTMVSYKLSHLCNSSMDSALSYLQCVIDFPVYTQSFIEQLYHACMPCQPTKCTWLMISLKTMSCSHGFPCQISWISAWEGCNIHEFSTTLWLCLVVIAIRHLPLRLRFCPQRVNLLPPFVYSQGWVRVPIKQYTWVKW